jgi:hypothetical protein
LRTVPLHGKYAQGRVALVDDADYDLVMQYTWHAHQHVRPGRSNLYARTSLAVSKRQPRRRIFMHNLIMDAVGIDHSDHDGLNNQRYNLRVATSVQNGQNRLPNAGAASAYKGVCWNKERGLWIAGIRVNGKLEYLGAFASDLEAARVYDAAAREAFGEFAYPNFS